MMGMEGGSGWESNYDKAGIRGSLRRRVVLNCDDRRYTVVTGSEGGGDLPLSLNQVGRIWWWSLLYRVLL